MLCGILKISEHTSLVPNIDVIKKGAKSELYQLFCGIRKISEHTSL